MDGENRLERRIRHTAHRGASACSSHRGSCGGAVAGISPRWACRARAAARQGHGQGPRHVRSAAQLCTL